jgi:hypothetical protein
MKLNFITRVFLTVIGVACLPAYGQESKLQKAIKESINDPDSVKFFEYKIMDDMACYVINAKNKMGGYAGKHSAILMRLEGQWFLTNVAQIGFDTCIDVIVKFKNK